MKQSKKIGWVSVLFVLMFSLHPCIVGASDSTTIPFPGSGYVGVCLYEIDDDDYLLKELQEMIFTITNQREIGHCWVTATVNGVQGIIHSDGEGVNFLYWNDFLALCKLDSIRLFKPNKKAIGYAELEEIGINLSSIPFIFRQLLAWHLGNLMIDTWIQEMLAYRGLPYDFGFEPSDDALYCSELLAYGWNNTGAAFELFPSQKAETLDGWSYELMLILNSLGYNITEDTDVYDVIYILSDEIRPYFTEITVD